MVVDPKLQVFRSQSLALRADNTTLVSDQIHPGPKETHLLWGLTLTLKTIK